MPDPRLLNILLRCGLSETEGGIVQDLLERGETTAGTLARRTNIKRATIYSALVQLEARGLVARRKQGSVGRFMLIPHADLVRTIQEEWKQRHQEVLSASTALGEVLKEYPEGRVKHIGGYEITSYESRKKTEEFFLSLLTRGHYASIFDATLFSSARWRPLMAHLLKVTALTKPPIREIILATEDPTWYVSQIRNPNHKIKILTSRELLVSDFTVTADSVILNTYEKGAEISLQIKHPSYVTMMQRIFDALWEVEAM